MTEEEFIELGAHLADLSPIVEAFCARHGFERITVGRYPRIRLVKEGPVGLWIALTMGLDTDGQRFTHFHPELPYELDAGAFLQQKEGAEDVHYSHYVGIWEAKPFREIQPVLEEALEDALAAIQGWDAAFLRSKGRGPPCRRAGDFSSPARGDTW